jgi:hypothetical protein
VDDCAVTLVLPKDIDDSFTPMLASSPSSISLPSTSSTPSSSFPSLFSSAAAAADAVATAKSAKQTTAPVTLPAPGLWHIMSQLYHARLDLLKIDVDGVELQAPTAL